MYLRIEQGSKNIHLRKINQLILKIFEYAAQYVEFDEEEFKQFIKDDKVWSAGSYRPGEPFYSKIKVLFTFSREERERIYRVIQHDMAFDQNIEEPDFVFEEQLLDGQQKKTVKELILFLYENPFRNDKFEIRGEITGYQQFKKSLFEHNSIYICPVCLSLQTNLLMYGEIDHYFPKKSYPALIFHPINLAVICGECNDFRVKGGKNPLETGNLTELYIPYLRDAEKETKLVVIEIEEEGKDGEQEKAKKMVMIPRGADANGLINKRIQNLDNLFDLSNRWTDRMNNTIKKQLEDLKDEKLESEVQELLHNRAKDCKRLAARDKTKLVEATTLEYIENKSNTSFWAEWCMRRKEQKIMSEFNANA